MSKKTRKALRPAFWAAMLGVVAMLAVLAAVALPARSALAQANPFLPPVPAGVTATRDSATQVTVTWTAGTGGLAATGYEVERKVGSGAYMGLEPAHAGDAPNYVDSTVTADMTYTYRVRASNGAGVSDWAMSNMVPTHTDPGDGDDPLSDVPAPGDFKIDALDNGARLSWDSLPDSQAYTVMGYQIDRMVYHADSSNPILVNTGDATIDIGLMQQYRDLGLSYGTTYTYRVRAYVSVPVAGGDPMTGHGPWSAAGTVITADSGGRLEPLLDPPTAVRMLTADPACANSITVSWQEPAEFGTVPATDDNGVYVGPDYIGGEGAGKEEVGEDATSVTYMVERMVGTGGWTMVTHTGTMYMDTDVEYGETYKYRVRAMNDQKLYGPWTMIEHSLVQPDGVNAPHNLRATLNENGEVTLQWTAPVGGNQSWFNGDMADPDVGNGDLSERLSYRIERVDADNVDTDFGQREQFHEYGPRSFDEPRIRQEQDYTDMDPYDGEATYVVTAFVDGCLPSEGNSVNLDTQIGNPGAPGNVSATASGNMITVTWTAPADPGSLGDRDATITGYNIERSLTSGSGFTAVASGHSGTSYTDMNLDHDTTYYYRVSAVNNFGAMSSASAEASAMTAAEMLGMASNIMPTNIGGGSIQVDWDAAAGADGYVIYAVNVAQAADPTGAHVASAVNRTTPTTWNLVGLTVGDVYDIYVVATARGATPAWAAPVRMTPQ